MNVPRGNDNGRQENAKEESMHCEGWNFTRQSAAMLDDEQYVVSTPD